MSSTLLKVITGIVAVAVGVTATYLLVQTNSSTQSEQINPQLQQLKPTVITTPEPTIDIVEPEVIVEQTPPPEVIDPEPTPVTELPPLEDSDQYVRTQLLQLSWHQDLAALLINDDLIRHTVVFIDNLAQGNVERGFSTLKGPVNSFSVIENEQEVLLNPDSYERYDIYVDILASFTSKDLISLFKTYQPFVQTIYAELGYPERSFNDTLIEAIDLALATPQVTDPIALVSPSAMYQFADQELESLPAIQKQIIRMGPDNSKKLKKLLQNLRRDLFAKH